MLVSRTRESVIGNAWGDGAEDLLERLEAIVGLHDDPTSFQTDHPVVAELHRRNLGLRFAASGSVLAALVVAVVGQKVTGSEAARAMRGLSTAFSSRAPGPHRGLRLPPEPSAMAEAPYWRFHELHLEQKRAEILKRVARSAVEIEALGDAPPDVAAAALRRINGVGEWTVAETLVRSHGDPDQLSVGDYHLKNMVVFHLTGRPRGTDEEMVDLLEVFRPHRGRVARLLHKLGHAPKYGPRTAPRNITSI